VTVAGGKLGFNEVELMIVQPRSGSLHPTLRRGRSPVGPDEIAISTQLLRGLHTTLGDTIELEGPAGTSEFTIVGEAIFPQLGNAEWGGAGSVTDNAVEALGLEATASMLLIDLAPGRSLADVRTIVGPDVLLRTPAPPPIVDNLREAEPILRVLAIFLALLAAATLAHALVTTAHRRRRDHATARAMGLTGRQLTAAFGWHSGTIALLATLVALPLGIIIGAVAWRLSTRNLGVLDTFHVPPITTVFIAIATPTIAVLGAVAVAINARRAPLATSLSTE
jgi:putative ABC transport system permease protein